MVRENGSLQGTVGNDWTTVGKHRGIVGIVRALVGSVRVIVGEVRERLGSRIENGSALVMSRRVELQREVDAIVVVNTGRRIVVCLRTETKLEQHQKVFLIQSRVVTMDAGALVE